MSTLIKYFATAVIVVSVWRVSNGDLTWIIDTTINLFNTAVDALTTLLSNTFDAPASTPSPGPTLNLDPNPSPQASP